MKFKKYYAGETKEPFPEYWVDDSFLSTFSINEFKYLLENFINENDIQKFLEKNSEFLSQMLSGHHGKWVIPKPKFGSEYIPDFILGDKDSTGYKWYLVELESPNKKVLCANGQQTANLSQAIKQINEWRIWLKKNISYARHELGFLDIDSEILAIIIIGRRKYIKTEHKELYRQLSNEKLIIMSYDRILY